MTDMIKGIPIVLYERTQTGSDPFGKPTYSETPVTVENVLVAPASDQEVTEAENLYGRKAVYTLGIPKGDKHAWMDRTVEFFGQKWHTIGYPIQGIEAMIPLEWNMKVRVEAYE